MPNQIFEALNGSAQNQNIIQQFQRFMQEMQGKNPHTEIQRLLQSGQVSQHQLTEAQQMAQQMQSLFSMFKK